MKVIALRRLADLVVVMMVWLSALAAAPVTREDVLPTSTEWGQGCMSP